MEKQQLSELYDLFLEHSVRYYVFNQPLICDRDFNAICSALLSNWAELQHNWKSITLQDDLRRCSGSHVQRMWHQTMIDLVGKNPTMTLKEKYPNAPARSKAF